MPRAVVDQLVIETLALSEAELRARVVDLEDERAIYRDLACAALDVLRRFVVARIRDRALVKQLIAELRQERQRSAPR